MRDDPSAPVTPLSSIHLVSPNAPNGSMLPDTPGALVGRERDIETLLYLLGTPEVRLLTLTGVGGTGKTRLAIEVAARARDRYADGAAFVALAPILDANHVATAIAQALGVREMADASLMGLIIAALQERRLLLLLDNFEHLLEAAPVIADLVAACPLLTVLVTSRAPLRLALEREVRVPPLELPHRVAVQLPGDVDRAASVRFFVEQAKAVVPGFALTSSNADAVAAICRWLERVLALPGSAPAEAVTVCHFIASSIAQALDSNELALQHSRVGLVLAREAGDRLGEGLALTMQSSVLLDSDPEAAEQASEAALACFWSLSARPQIIAVCLGIIVWQSVGQPLAAPRKHRLA